MNAPTPLTATRPRGGAIAALGVGTLAAVLGGAWLAGRRGQPAVEARTRARLASPNLDPVDPGRE